MHTPEIYIPGRLLNGWMGTDELYWLHEKAKEMSEREGVSVVDALRWQLGE